MPTSLLSIINMIGQKDFSKDRPRLDWRQMGIHRQDGRVCVGAVEMIVLEYTLNCLAQFDNYSYLCRAKQMPFGVEVSC